MCSPLSSATVIPLPPLVSCDFNHNSYSSVFDLTQTQTVEGGLVRILSWYDNEWGFSNRMLDTAVAYGNA